MSHPVNTLTFPLGSCRDLGLVSLQEMMDWKTVLGLWAEGNIWLEEKTEEVFTDLLLGSPADAVSPGTGREARLCSRGGWPHSQEGSFQGGVSAQGPLQGRKTPPEQHLSEFSQDACSARSENEPVFLQ